MRKRPLNRPSINNDRFDEGTGLKNSHPFTPRYLFSATDELLYIGVTNDLQRRLSEHRWQQTWGIEVAHHTVEVFDTSSAAYSHEAKLIAKFHPRFNRLGNPSPPPLKRRRYSKRKGEELSSLMIWIDQGLHKQLRITAVTNGQRMVDVVEAALEEYLKEAS